MDVSTTKRSSTVLIPVFIPAVIVIALLVIGTISNPERAGAFSLSYFLTLRPTLAGFIC